MKIRASVLRTDARSTLSTWNVDELPKFQMLSAAASRSEGIRAQIDVWLRRPLTAREFGHLDLAVESSLPGRDPVVLPLGCQVRIGFAVLDKGVGADGIVRDFAAGLRSFIGLRDVVGTSECILKG